jgi:nucleoside-diphosphate-sugar epimerase
MEERFLIYMNVLLTGITGSLGFEIALSLNKKGVDILPVVRNRESLDVLGLDFKHAIETDLTKEIPSIELSRVDCIIHSAGNIHFEKSGDSNSKMMQSVVHIAEEYKVPVYYVSTAFLWRKPGSTEQHHNAYETDKAESERILQDSGVPHKIFRPSVLVGNSESGQLINWSGYYLLVAKFLEAAEVASGSKIRFPILTGSSNMVPVNQAAEIISETVNNNTLGSLVYVTNPEPPKAQWVLDVTLDFLGIKEKFEFLDIGFPEYEKLRKTQAEEILYLSGKHFSPYWSLPYNFPESALAKNLISEEYIKKTLKSFRDSHNISTV